MASGVQPSNIELTPQLRPLLSRDVFYASLDDAVLIHNSKEGFQIRSASAYDAADELLPRLDGHRTLGELEADLDAPARRRVRVLLTELLRRGFARAVDPDADRNVALGAEVQRRYEAQIEYIRHYRDGALRAFDSYRGLRVGVLGDDDVAQWCAISLVRNGVGQLVVEPALLARTPEDGSQLCAEAGEAEAAGAPVVIAEWPHSVSSWVDVDDLDVVVTGVAASSTRALFALAGAGVPQGRALLGAFRMGDEIVIGPYTTSQGRACPTCAALRLGANVEGATSAAFWSSLATEADAEEGVPIAEPLRAMLGNLLAFEIFRVGTGILPAETDGRAVLQNLHTADVRAATVLAHPRCAVCYDAKPATAPVAADTLDRALQRPDEPAPSVDDLDAAGVERLAQRDVLIDERLGVFTAFDDADLLQSPVKNTRLRFGVGHLQRRCVSASDVHTVLRARLAAVDAAARCYVDEVLPLRPDDPGSTARVIAGAALTTWTGLDAGDPPGQQLVTGWSLFDAEPVQVPLGAVGPFGPGNDRGRWERSTAGTGVGEDLDAAVADGLDSVLAFDARTAVVAGRERCWRIDVDWQSDAGDAAAGPELAFVLRSARTMQHPIELVELGERTRPRCVVLARSSGRWSVRCAATMRRAAQLAACDVLGQLQAAHDSHDSHDSAGSRVAADSRDSATDFDGALRVAGSCTLRTVPDPIPDSAAWRGAGIADLIVVSRPSLELHRAGLVAVRVLLARER